MRESFEDVEIVELYRENILDHYKNPRNKRKLELSTHTHEEHNPLCGDEIVIYLKVSDSHIIDISFTGEGCAISQAAASMLTEELVKKSVREVLDMSMDDVLSLLGIPISHTRMKCALLAHKTIKGALQKC